MKYKLSILSFFTFIGLVTYGQQVTNINAHVTEDNKIVVEYTISGAKFNQSFNISLFVSTDEGQTYEGPLTQVTGNVGKGITGGKHTIIWDFLNEMPITDEDLVFDVRAEVIETPVKRSWFVSYVGNTITYLGLRVGMIGKVGWYAEGRMNMPGLEKSSYEFNGETVVEYDKQGYYQFSNNNGYSSFFAGAGLTFQPGKDFFIYAGAGYGKENYLYEIDDYSYENEAKTGTTYVKDPDYSNWGVEVDAGIIYRFNKLLFTGGATTVNFNTINWTAGVGISF